MNARRVLYSLAALALTLGLFTGAAPAAAQSGGEEISRDTLYVPGEVVVGFEPGLAPSEYGAQASALAGTVGAQVVDQSGTVFLLSFAEDADVPALAAQIGGIQGVAYAEPNYIRWVPEMLMDQSPRSGPHEMTEIYRRTPDGKRMTISVDELKAMRTMRKSGRRVTAIPTYPNDAWENWGWWYIGANIIWPNAALSPTVCVVDTGIDILHPDLAGKAINGYDFVNEDALPYDDFGHGTHVAGTIAAKANNGIGLAGVSNGRVLGVKVLSAQGWGTVFDIVQGITYCANRLDVKVINMSLGGYGASESEFGALEYAINTKGKLVVAAAGNGSTSDFFFPAAWAGAFVCKNGSETFPSPCASNTIAQGMLAVGAARSPWSWEPDEDGYLWVDTNGSGVHDSDEDFWVDACAAWFSNYGAWVQIVAPGEDIFSTTPVSYPFSAAYFWGAWPEYDWWSGTSMATPHVAGAAARTWSVNPLYTNAQIKDRLLNTGWGLWTGMDPWMFDPSDGYWDGGYQGEAPYCWPDSTYGDFYSMENSVYLDVAAAMNRGAITAAVSEAITALPLENALVYAYQGLILRDTAKVSRWSRWVDLINLPAGPTYNIKVGKGGYTAGAVRVADVWVDPGWYAFDTEAIVAIPPMGRITAVANSWWWYGVGDLDLYTWLPNVSSPGGVVGYGGSGHDQDLGPGDLSDFPRARWNRDGGAGDWMEMESVSIVPRPGFPAMPYYNITSGDYYNFFLTDYGSGELNDNDIYFRVWRTGLPIATVVKTYWCDTGGGEEWWWAGYFQYGTFYPVDYCGIGAPSWSGGIWPYANLGGTQGVPERPFGK